MELMGRVGPRTYPDSFRDRAVRLVWEWRDSRGITTGGIADVAKQLNMNRETRRKWVVDAGTVEAAKPRPRPRPPRPASPSSSRNGRRPAPAVARRSAPRPVGLGVPPPRAARHAATSKGNLWRGPLDSRSHPCTAPTGDGFGRGIPHGLEKRTDEKDLGAVLPGSTSVPRRLQLRPR